MPFSYLITTARTFKFGPLLYGSGSNHSLKSITVTEGNLGEYSFYSDTTFLLYLVIAKFGLWEKGYFV